MTTSDRISVELPGTQQIVDAQSLDPVGSRVRLVVLLSEEDHPALEGIMSALADIQARLSRIENALRI